MRVANRGHDVRCLRRGESPSFFPSPHVARLELTLVQSIEGMLRTQPGIHSVKVALLAERGVVEFDPQQWDAGKVIDVSFSRRVIQSFWLLMRGPSNFAFIRAGNFGHRL
jgi:hypothetical protein